MHIIERGRHIHLEQGDWKLKKLKILKISMYIKLLIKIFLKVFSFKYFRDNNIERKSTLLKETIISETRSLSSGYGALCLDRNHHFRGV
jgi:hypothetical protein